MHLKAICFVRCTDENVQKICNQLRNPSFSSYNLCKQLIQNKFDLLFVDFSNTLANDKIQKFAESDVHNVVNQVQEVFADFKTINEDLFSLDVGSTLSLSLHQPNMWTLDDQANASRIVDGLFGVLMATRSNPVIRYEGSSPLCRYVAERLQEKVTAESDFIVRMSRNSPSTQLLICDRKEDPVTPLLNQWTYQAMVHELIGIKDNRVDLRHVEGLADEMKEVVLSGIDDTFFRRVLHHNFGDLSNEIQSLVKKFLDNKKSQAQFNSIEDMQRVIENFPEFKQSQRNTTKHFSVMDEMKKLVEGRSLYELSELEQELASGSQGTSKQNNFNKAAENIDNPDISKMEKLRLLILFALRYENDTLVYQLKQKMRTCGVTDEKLRLVDWVLEYAGK